MKRKAYSIWRFICFYLTLPAFILAVLIAGIDAIDMPAEASAVGVEIYEMREVSPLPTRSIDADHWMPEDALPIIGRDLSGEYNVLNATSREIDEEALASRPLPHSSDEPTVLIVHTHATECYAADDSSFASPDGSGYYGHYTSDTATRTDDPSLNMIAIGEEFCRVLAENGIGTIHCRVMHDKDDYNSSYANSRSSIKYYLENYPSIEYVIDIHRDSLETADKERIKTLADGLDGCAQVMLVAGCNGNGVVYPNWEENLSLALKYKKVMDKKYPSLSRPIYLRYSKYNLDLKTGSLLLEVGSCANTLEEAKKAAVLAAECFVETLN